MAHTLAIMQYHKKFKTNLEFHDVLLTLANDLYNDCHMSEYSDNYDRVWLDKYVHKTYGKRDRL